MRCEAWPGAKGRDEQRPRYGSSRSIMDRSFLHKFRFSMTNSIASHGPCPGCSRRYILLRDFKLDSRIMEIGSFFIRVIIQHRFSITIARKGKTLEAHFCNFIIIILHKYRIYYIINFILFHFILVCLLAFRFIFYISFRGRSLHRAARKSSSGSRRTTWASSKIWSLLFSIAKRYQSSIFSLLISLRHELPWYVSRLHRRTDALSLARQAVRCRHLLARPVP